MARVATSPARHVRNHASVACRRTSCSAALYNTSHPSIPRKHHALPHASNTSTCATRCHPAAGSSPRSACCPSAIAAASASMMPRAAAAHTSSVVSIPTIRTALPILAASATVVTTSSPYPNPTRTGCPAPPRPVGDLLAPPLSPGAAAARMLPAPLPLPPPPPSPPRPPPSPLPS
eukprot:2237307-Prymnesium_polylepis.1